ncbi:MAG: precorrin-8X methylmutase [Chitinispirillaceae bacterium]
MKSLLLCIVSSKFESEIVQRIKTLMKHRLDDCDIREVVAGSGFNQAEFVRTCHDSCKAGYKRIYIQAATLAFSQERYQELMNSLEELRRTETDAEFTAFPPVQLHEECADLIERNIYHASLIDTPFKETPPDQIQMQSFDFISRRLAGRYSDEDTKAVVVRVIHATADFSIEPLLRFSADAVDRGKEAIKNGCAIITDVGMVSAGLATRFKDRTINAIGSEGVAACASEKGLTRSAAAFELLAARIEGTVVAIGNAPTALVHLLTIIRRTGVRPACIVGVPVGFIGAAESKELLMASDIPHISLKGNRGGTPVAVAAVNALGCL